MWRTLILILILFTSIAFAQKLETPIAYKFKEAGIGTECDINLWADEFRRELEKSQNLLGYVLTYRAFNQSHSKYFLQNEILRTNFRLYNVDEKRLFFVDSGFREKYSIEFWLVPNGAELPKPSNRIIKFDEFGNVSEKVWKAKLDKLYEKWQQNREDQIYIVMFGSKKLTEKLAKKYLNYSVRCVYEGCMQMFITNWGVRKNLRTIIWIVPPDADPPIPNSQN